MVFKDLMKGTDDDVDVIPGGAADPRPDPDMLADPKLFVATVVDFGLTQKAESWSVSGFLRHRRGSQAEASPPKIR